MLWGRIYAVWDPSLVQVTLRARNASSEPFIREFAEKSFGLSAETTAKNVESLPGAFIDATHGSMQPKHVNEMNVIALNYISRTLDGLCRHGDDAFTLTVPNLYLWFRDIITLATTRALLGRENPYEKDTTLIQTAW